MKRDGRKIAIEPTGQRILVALPNWVGDVAWATPALASIRCHFGDSRITYLCRPYVQGVFLGGPFMDNVIKWQRKKSKAGRRENMLRLSARLRRRKFDIAVLMTNSFRSALVSRLAGIKRIVGYDRDGRGMLLTDRLLAPRSGGKFLPISMTRYFNGIAAYLGCDNPGTRPRLYTTPDDESAVRTRLEEAHIGVDKPLVVINPGASYGSSKCWYPRRFAQVADALGEKLNANIVVVCGPGERDIARQTGLEMKRDALICVDPVMPITQLKALLKRAQLLVTNDTGPRPIAMAFDVPIVTIFGSTDPAWTEIHYPYERQVMIPVECGPCMKPTCPEGHHKCMDGVTAEMVVDAADQLLEQRIPEQPTA